MVYGNSLPSSTLLQSQLLSVVILCSGNRSLLSPNAVLIEFKHKIPECFCINHHQKWFALCSGAY